MSAPGPWEAEARFARENPAGERELHYRVDTYASFLRRMTAALPLARATVDGVSTRPLERLDPGSSRDFAHALLDAWAMVGDVLTFYQERLLNEGFLRTAVEPRSVRELTAQLGFSPRPGVASSTVLAFTVSGAPGAPHAIEVPAGTAAQSIPGTHQKPQTFETSAALRARPAWNALAPAPRFITQAPTLAVTGTQARLAGTGTGLSLGAPILAVSGDGAAWAVGTVTRVEASAPAGETRVAWAAVPGGVRGTGALAAPAVWAFGRTARLFGYNAAAWSALSTEQKRTQREILGGVFVLRGGGWAGASGGLPAVDVRVLLVDPAGRVYAGTAGQGIHASADGGRTWTAGGPRLGDVYSLAPGGPGIVYAGLSGGRVLRSADGGGSWDSVSGNAGLAVDRRGEPAAVVVTRLPAGPVRALFDDGGTLYAGTDFGVYRSGEAAPAWRPVPFHPAGHAPVLTPSHPAGAPPSPAPAAPSPDASSSSAVSPSTAPPAAGSSPAAPSSATPPSPSASPAAPPPAGPSSPAESSSAVPPPPVVSSAAPPAVWCFARAPWGEIVAGTDAGVWSVDHGRLLAHGLPTVLASGLPNVVRALIADGANLLAATDAGLFALGPPTLLADLFGRRWRSVPGPELLGTALPVRGLAEAPRGLLAATPAGVFARSSAGVWSRVEDTASAAGAPAPGGGSAVPGGSTASGGTPMPGGSASASGTPMPGGSASADGTPMAGGSASAGGASAPGGSGSPGGGSSRSGTGTAPAAGPGDCGLPVPVPAPPGLNHLDVVALAAGAGRVVAATPYAGFPVEAWPSPPVCDGVVQLSGVIPQVVPGSWMVLQQAPDPAGGGPAAAVAVVKVTSARTLTLERYGRRGQATEVTVEPAAGLEVFDLRATSVYAASRALPLLSPRLPDLVPFAGKRLRLAGAIPALPPGRGVSVSGRPIRAAVWPCAGVFVRAGETWAPAGLASVDVVAVAWAPGGTLLAAVGGAPGEAGPAAGLYASADGGATWTRAGAPLAGVRVHALAAGAGAVWAAGSKGAVFASADGAAWTAAGTTGHGVTALAVAPDGRVYAATHDGGVLLRGADGGWAPAGAGLPAGKVRALAATAAGVAAATPHGMWWLAAGAAAWTPWSDGLANLDVLAVAALPGGEVLVGTRGGGVFSAAAPAAPWRPDSAGLGAPGARTVTVLAAAADGGAWAGTRGAGCFVRAAGDAAWTATASGAANDVRALAAGPGGVAAGCGGAPLLVTPAGTRASLALDSLFSLPEGSVADLDQGSLSTALGKAFQEAGVALPPTSVIRVRQAGEAWWIAARDGVLLLRRDAGAVRVRRPRGLATLMGPCPPSGSVTGVAVADADGGTGTLTPRDGELLWQAASPASPPLGEVAVVAGSATAGLRRTVLTLRSPLAHAYDPATVRLCGNVAEATQGATQGAWPRPEVLGSGDASRPGQRFRLARAPLTWLAGEPPVSTLKVWVNGMRWTEVESLFTRGPGDPVYEVVVDHAGAATVRFGDGVNGARLPTGVGNVTAQYRVGTGPAGNLGAGRVTQLRAAPLGVRAATNPVPAQGGAPGQTPAQTVASAPVRARVLDRVVGQQDFRDYALGWPGITRAVAEPLRDPRGRAVLAVTVVGETGAEVPGDEVVRALATAMAKAGAHGRFRVLACEPLSFFIRARVDCDPRRRPQAVWRAAAAALDAAYDPARAVPGQGAAASDVIAVLQGVPGVVGVELAAFYLAGHTPAVHNWLEARGARVGPHGTLLPAQLLLPAAPGGITVHAREAP